VCTSYAQFNNYQHLIREGKFRILMHLDQTPVPGMPPAVPSIYRFATTSEQRLLLTFVFSSVEFGRPYFFPPEGPRERVALMRAALRGEASARVARAPQRLAEAEKAGVDMTFIAPARLEELVDTLYRTPPELIETVKRLVPNLQ